jgi:hypothetical protein
MERRHEVLDVVWQSLTPKLQSSTSDDCPATEGVEAQALLDAQLRRFTLREPARITEERDRLRSLAATSPDDAARIPWRRTFGSGRDPR